MDRHLTEDDMTTFTKLRMTAFGRTVIDLANDPTYDDWTFSQKIHYAMDTELTARQERRTQKLLKASKSPNPEACVEEIRYLPGRNLNREHVGRLASCQWIDQTNNLVVLGTSSVGKTYLAQALLNAACRKFYTARFFRLGDLANQLSVLSHDSQQRLNFLNDLHNCDLLVLDDFLTTPINQHIAAELLNITAARDGKGSTLVTSQFDPEDWYKTFNDAVIAESILNRIVGSSEILQLNGPNMRQHKHLTE
ncbi:MAG: ATP-binding protein [Micrococcaceae bacterium]|nr:ATP-binding protein [Micrococcaceae bacterium]